jgi:hypothetical protein
LVVLPKVAFGHRIEGQRQATDGFDLPALPLVASR